MTRTQIKDELGYFPSEFNNFDGDIPVGNVAQLIQMPKETKPDVIAKFNDRLSDIWGEPALSEDAKTMARELFRRANHTPSPKIQKILGV